MNTLLLSKVALYCVLTCGLLMQCGAAEKVDFEALTKSLQAMILDSRTTYEDLQEAISRLGKATEPPSFWRSIINDQSYSLRHRRKCIKALLERHRPTTVYELSLLLDKPKWLRDEDIQRVDYVVGAIPVEWTPDDSIFSIRLLPGSEPDKTDLSAYVRVAGKVTRDDFSRVARADAVALPYPQSAGFPIAQLGYSDILR